VAAIEGLDLGPRGPNGSAVAKVRDWFLFSLYAQGMRFSDVMQLRRKNVTREEDGDAAGYGEGRAVYRVRYRMGKTGKLNAVLLVPQALAIIEPYLQRIDDPEAYLFDALDRYDTSTPKGLHDALSSRNASRGRRP
jgi:integrase